MNTIKSVISLVTILLCFLNPAFAQNIENFSIQEDDGRHFQVIDDMLIEVDGEGPLSVLRKDIRKWPNGILPIKFEDGYEEAEKQTFFDGCALWSMYTKVKCIDYQDHHKDYILVVATVDVNNSKVGRIGGEQILNLADRGSEGVIAHEIAHALGFAHQHNSPERDKYVKIEWENIKKGKEHNFTIVSEKHSVVFGFYDYCSIMHYPKDGLSKDSNSTITVIGNAPSCTMGQRDYLSEPDKMGMVDAYGRDADDTLLVKVPDFKTIYADDIKRTEYIFRRYGVRPILIEGKLNRPWCTIGVCERTCFWDTISWQFPEPNTIVEFGTAVSLRAQRNSEAQFNKPPDGQQCN